MEVLGIELREDDRVEIHGGGYGDVVKVGRWRVHVKVDSGRVLRLRPRDIADVFMRAWTKEELENPHTGRQGHRHN